MGELNAEQALAVKHYRGPMLVLAGPGSGKTFTLVERIRYLIENNNVNPRKILVITFSKKAALEMQARFNNLYKDKNYPVTFGTFHAIFYHILKCHKNYSKDSILTPKQKRKILSIIAEKYHIEELLNESVMEDYLAKISLCKTNNLSIDENIERFLFDENEGKSFQLVYKEYIGQCKHMRKIDFDDMLYECYELLNANTSILEQWRNVYKYFLVDEFQDINDVQYEVLNLLAGPEQNIFAVGDDDQSIYGFRGSKPSIMKTFQERKGCQVINLSKNYRCAEEVIKTAFKLICNNTDRIFKQQIASKPHKEIGFVKLLCAENIDKEADLVINTIKEKCADISFKLESTAILYRNKKCADILEEKLMMANIPYERKNEVSDFYDSETMLDLASYFRVCIGKSERTDIFRILNKPDRGLTREVFSGDFNENIDNNIDIIKISGLYDMYPGMKSTWTKFLKDIKMIEGLPCYAAINYIFKGMGYEKYMMINLMKKGMKKDEIIELQEEIYSRSRNFINIREWLKYIEEINKLKENGITNSNDIYTDQSYTDGLHKVVMQTMHASKGLEYDNVFIIGLQEGISPHKKAVTDEQIEEERRLLYVAITRAKKYLYIIGRGDNEHGKRMSRFIFEIFDEIV